MNTPPSFDRIARFYRALEYVTLGRALERTRFALLHRLLNARNTLVLGDGDGRFTAELLARNPVVRVTAIDASETMLSLLQQRCHSSLDRLRTIYADVRNMTFPAGERYDAIATHFMLDCLQQGEVEQLIRSTVPSLHPGALWVVSDFRIPTGHLALPTRVFVRSLYLAFRILTGLRVTQLPDHIALFENAGFRLVERKLFLAGILVTELWQAPLAGGKIP